MIFKLFSSTDIFSMNVIPILAGKSILKGVILTIVFIHTHLRLGSGLSLGVTFADWVLRFKV